MNDDVIVRLSSAERDGLVGILNTLLRTSGGVDGSDVERVVRRLQGAGTIDDIASIANSAKGVYLDGPNKDPFSPAEMRSLIVLAIPAVA